MPKSFAELESAEVVTIEELKVSLEDYALSGAAISARVVIKIVDGLNPSGDDLENLIASASEGVQVHKKLREAREVREYETLLGHLRGFVGF